MNRPLRRRHLLLVSVLAPVAALLLIAAIATRRPVPVNPPLPFGPDSASVAR